MTSEVKWELVKSRRYERHFERYQHDQVVIKALLERLGSLRGAKDPKRLGDYKIGKLKGTYGIRLSKSVRLLYMVDYGGQVIRLLDIGNHKEVYGHD